MIFFHNSSDRAGTTAYADMQWSLDRGWISYQTILGSQRGELKRGGVQAQPHLSSVHVLPLLSGDPMTTWSDLLTFNRYANTLRQFPRPNARRGGEESRRSEYINSTDYTPMQPSSE